MKRDGLQLLAAETSTVQSGDINADDADYADDGDYAGGADGDPGDTQDEPAVVAKERKPR